MNEMIPGIYYVGCEVCGHLMHEEWVELALMEEGKLSCAGCGRDIHKDAVIEHLTKVNVKLREKNNETS